MPEPPVVITGGSVHIKLSSEDFPASPQEVNGNVRIASVEVKDENNNVVSTVNFPNGKFTVTFYKSPQNSSSK
ncbi:MAG TPA: hypothetical protein VEY09_14050 [Pyrinomonadaceae bacterium]|nr:hypothetical protein [Pyrinomonadaceae bacterium]